MSSPEPLSLDVHGEARPIHPEVVVVAGYTGADQQSVAEHIDELAAEGIAPPPQVPMFWAMPARALSQEPSIDVPSSQTSGELELAVVVDGNDRFLAAASDHTCRKAEAIDIRLSKLICPTPLSSDAWPWSDVADHWAELELTSEIETAGSVERYQAAPAGGNIAPSELLDRIPWGIDRPRSFVLLCGTVPAIGGIRPAARFTGVVRDPRSGHSLSLDYLIQPIPSLALAGN